MPHLCISSRSLLRSASRMAAGIRSASCALPRETDGVAAFEFALIAPIVVFALLATSDLGTAAYRKMGVDHVLRAGVETAMKDPGAEQVLNVLRATASEDFPLADSSPPAKGQLALQVDRYCVCPDSTGNVVDCSAACPDERPSYRYYRFQARLIQTGMLIPEFDLDPSLEVQVR